MRSTLLVANNAFQSQAITLFFVPSAAIERCLVELLTKNAKHSLFAGIVPQPRSYISLRARFGKGSDDKYFNIEMAKAKDKGEEQYMCTVKPLIVDILNSGHL